MSNTLPNIDIPKNSTVELYAEVEINGRTINTGEKLRVTNIGSSEIRLYSGDSYPLDDFGYVVLRPYATAENCSDDVGAYAVSPSSKGKLSVEVI